MIVHHSLAQNDASAVATVSLYAPSCWCRLLSQFPSVIRDQQLATTHYLTTEHRLPIPDKPALLSRRERLPCKQEVPGSIPWCGLHIRRHCSTISHQTIAEAVPSYAQRETASGSKRVVTAFQSPGRTSLVTARRSTVQVRILPGAPALGCRAQSLYCAIPGTGRRTPSTEA